MATVNQVEGGAFTDVAGNPVANGSITFELSSDEQVNSTTQICSAYIVTATLNSSGSVPSSPVTSLWPNDLITPSGSFYIITVYSSTGERVFGPVNNQILSTPSPFDLGTLVPNNY